MPSAELSHAALAGKNVKVQVAEGRRPPKDKLTLEKDTKAAGVGEVLQISPSQAANIAKHA